jgi:glycerophosphoryl diester phosphodiesterase
MLRRRKADAPFLRENLAAALNVGAACEVDIVFTADGHAVCLHDRTLDRETTGHGRVADTTRAEIERLHQRSPDGAALASALLFLDEVVDAVKATPAIAPAQVQLDIKTNADALSAAAVDRFARVVRDASTTFVASAYDWHTVSRLAAAVPGLHAGFDPLAFYPRSFALDAAGFRAVAARTRATAPSATIYYVEARLILAALAQGVDFVRELAGTLIDAWTIDADHPRLQDVLQQIIRLGCHQITSNDPDRLAPIIEAIATKR